MRLWSLHPKYLDAKGLVALWREGLLAKNVLENKTRGYKQHPQLERFRKSKRPVDSIIQYLSIVYSEAERRGYNFDKNKIKQQYETSKLNVTTGQIAYERAHLLNKLKIRDIEKYEELQKIKIPEAHSLFEIVEGPIEDWEVIRLED